MRSIERMIANHLCQWLRCLLPASMKSWGDALRCEVDDIVDDREAMGFAIAALPGLLWIALADNFVPVSRSLAMLVTGKPINPRRVALGCGIVSAFMGLFYLTAADAPAAYLAVNFAALILGISLVALIARLPVSDRWARYIPAVMAAILLATALFGSSVEGAARWIAIGPLFVQTSLIVLPWMHLRFARFGDTITMLSLCAAALAVALQPDRAMAGVMFASMLALSLHRFDRNKGVALVAASIAFLVTTLRSDTLPAVRYVDQVFYSAFDVHPMAGLAVVLGAAMLVIPAFVIWRSSATHRPVALVFGAIWCAMIAAAASGNYPTPVVGYGGSAILGYLISLLGVPGINGREGTMEPDNSARSDSARSSDEARLRLA